jgi:hypothetical protein
MIKQVTRCGLAVAILALAGPAAAETTTAPTTPVTVEILTVTGTGCPTATALVAMAPDNTALSFALSSFSAEISPVAASSRANRSCQITLDVDAPDGLSFAIHQIDSTGYVSVADGASTVHALTHTFQGITTTHRISHTIDGPYEHTWEYNDVVPEPSRLWRPCDDARPLVLGVELSVDPGNAAPGSESFIVMEAPQVYWLSWGTC